VRKRTIRNRTRGNGTIGRRITRVTFRLLKKCGDFFHTWIGRCHWNWKRSKRKEKSNDEHSQAQRGENEGGQQRRQMNWMEMRVGRNVQVVRREESTNPPIEKSSILLFSEHQKPKLQRPEVVRSQPASSVTRRQWETGTGSEK